MNRMKIKYWKHRFTLWFWRTFQPNRYAAYWVKRDEELRQFVIDNDIRY